MVDGFSPEDVWTPFGAFSMGVIQGEGQVVYLKGQVALDKSGQVIGKGDMRAQTRKTLENIQAVLASIGGKMADVVSLTHYVTDIDEFMKTGDIRREFFAKPFPVLSENYVQTSWWCNPDRIGMATMAPDRWTARPRGASLPNAKCVRTSLYNSAT